MKAFVLAFSAAALLGLAACVDSSLVLDGSGTPRAIQAQVGTLAID